jgi:hypothetical protein
MRNRLRYEPLHPAIIWRTRAQAAARNVFADTTERVLFPFLQQRKPPLGSPLHSAVDLPAKSGPDSDAFAPAADHHPYGALPGSVPGCVGSLTAIAIF